jgi:lipopolysaccharide exporter
MVRMMPKNDVGVWVLYTSITAILEMIRHGFIRNPFIAHFVSEENEGKKKVITSSLVLHSTLALLISIFLLICAGPLTRFWEAAGLDSLFYLYALNTIIFIPFLHFEYLQAAKSNFKAIFICNLWRHGLPALFVIVSYFTLYDITLAEIVIAQIFATFTGSMIAYSYVKDLAKQFSKVDRTTLKELFHFGKYTLGTNISSMIVKGTGSWMIGRLISVAGVAVYNPALRITNLIEVPTLTVANMVFPRISEKMKAQGAAGVRDIYYKSVSLILASMLPAVICLYVFAETIVTLLFGSEYVESALFLRVTLFYCLIIPFNRQFGTLMDGLKLPKVNFYLIVLVVVLNVILNFLFLKWFGLVGAAYGTLLSYLIVLFLNQIILYRMFNINTLKVFAGIGEWYKLGWAILMKRIVRLA